MFKHDGFVYRPPHICCDGHTLGNIATLSEMPSHTQAYYGHLLAASAALFVAAQVVLDTLESGAASFTPTQMTFMKTTLLDAIKKTKGE